MNRLAAILTEHWLLVALALATLAGLARIGFGKKPWWTLTLVPPVLLAGHFLFGFLTPKDLKPWELAGWVAIGLVGILLLAIGNLVVSGRWSAILAKVVGVLLLFAIGGLVVEETQSGVIALVQAARSVGFVQPWWLLLTLVIPLIVRFSYQSLAGLGPTRRWVALGLRCGIVLFLAVALAEPRVRRPNEHVAVLYVVDRSMSVPLELSDQSGVTEDLRWLKIQKFINDSVRDRGSSHRNDLSGSILFAKRPRLVLPPGAVDRLIVTDSLAGQMDANYTDIAAALKLAMASFPEGTGKRIVLISDGNENLGNAEDQANLAKQNNVQIDVVPLAEGYKQVNEVLVQAVEAPPQTSKGARLPIRVLVRNAHPSRIVFGKLELLQNREGAERPIAMVGRGEDDKSPYLVRLVPGLNTFTFRDKAESKKNADDELSYSYRALFTPVESRNSDNTDASAGLPGDRVQNNNATAHVIARGTRRVLFIERARDRDGTFPHQHLIDQLRGAKFLVVPKVVAELPQNRDEFAVYLSNFDCVVIGDVPSEELLVHQEAIRANTYDQGCGLVFVGGPDSYGAGGYQKTPIEAALPVDCEIKSIKAAGRGGLVLVMHASEMADGNKWQKEVAKLAIDKLSPVDMVGVLYFTGTTTWHVPFQEVGEDRGRLKSLIDRMTPGDMIEFDSFLKAAYDTLSDPKHELAVKHTLIISDGDPQLGPAGRGELAKMKAGSITCSTVGVATHSAAEDKKMTEMAEGAAPGGRYYPVKNAEQLPSIYMRESRRVSQSFLYTKQFNPKLVLRSGPADKLDPPLPDLFGFVRTTMKSSPLAEMLVEAPKYFDQRFPLLASWQYGLGRSVAFTSDARSKPGKQEGWDKVWAGSDMYLKFWESAVGWAMRGLETDKLVLTTEYREGKVRVVVEARDEGNRPITDLKLEGAVSNPGGLKDAGKPLELKFEQRAGGYYEAEFKSEEAGTYIINAKTTRLKPVYTGKKEPGKPQGLVELDGKLQLTDGTPVKRNSDGKVVYSDDGTPVPEQMVKEVDSRRAGVSISYSPEFADLETNATLLRSLARITGGQVYSEDAKSLKELSSSGDLYRPAPEVVRALLPLWYWLVFLAGVGLLFDVAVRRISVEPAELALAGQQIWARYRRTTFVRATATGDDPFLIALKQRKAQAGEAIEREKSTRKFEGTGEPKTAAPVGADAGDTTAKPILPPPPPVAKPEPKADEPEDYFSKLKKAKQRAPHERDE
jgi:uncharacterized membrane protein